MSTPQASEFELSVSTSLDVVPACFEACEPQARVDSMALDEVAEFSIHHAINVVTRQAGDPELPTSMTMEVIGHCSGPIAYCGALTTGRCGMSITSVVRPVETTSD